MEIKDSRYKWDDTTGEHEDAHPHGVRRTWRVGSWVEKQNDSLTGVERGQRHGFPLLIDHFQASGNDVAHGQLSFVGGRGRGGGGRGGGWLVHGLLGGRWLRRRHGRSLGLDRGRTSRSLGGGTRLTDGWHVRWEGGRVGTT